MAEIRCIEMMVIFVSRSEKKANATVRWILDSFADRIGTDTWKTVITEDGLSTIKMLLRKNATKNMAVACHWVRSRNRSDLIWIVGNRNRFNENGVIPVNITQKNIQHNEWENAWDYLPEIKALTALAALFHDWGKANKSFQKKLKSKQSVTDPFRHEWISCRLIAALVLSTKSEKDDLPWLSALAAGNLSEKKILAAFQQEPNNIFKNLPPIAALICWLILSHHRLPILGKNEKNGYDGVEMNSLLDMMAELNAKWGYEHELDLDEVVTFKKGLLFNSKEWVKRIKKWAGRLLTQKDFFVQKLTEKSMRLILCYARISLMLSDYSVSSQEADTAWKGQDCLYANTFAKNLKQKLDEHLVRVTDQSLQVLQRLPQFVSQMEAVQDIRSLRRKSSGMFAWQDKAVECIKSFRQEYQINWQSSQGWFIVNMASTGCGKTIANAKIMQAISVDGESLRYSLALGLRSLTLQTGTEYRNRIGLQEDELAVVIGSSAVRELYETSEKSRETEGEDCFDTEHAEPLLNGEIEFVPTTTDGFLDIFFSGAKNKDAESNKAFLYKPVLVSTIDHIMPAVETIKGGKYMLPFLRLMSSDLVIDEIDDFGRKDLVAIARLVHLAGMLGRNVAISSATIPPDLAEGLFQAYYAGRMCYADFFKSEMSIACVWCDEFKSTVHLLQGKELAQQYQGHHNAFVDKRVGKLQHQFIKRKAYVVNCTDIMKDLTQEEKMTAYFMKIQEAIGHMHEAHYLIDEQSGKKISFGLVRMAHIDSCVALSLFLLNASWAQGCIPKLMTYHSRQILLLRHKQEEYLDLVLKRKGMTGRNIRIQDSILRQHIDGAEEKNIIFLVIATPVEEIGRDHDFDWAVVEPSSYRSLIQLVGRILRHRKLEQDIVMPNVAVMQYNLRALLTNDKRVFYRPGYETEKRYQLDYHDMELLVDKKIWLSGIDAIPRIVKPAQLNPQKSLIDLEHFVMQDFGNMTIHGPDGLAGWISEFWWLTGIPQCFNSFREGQPQLNLYYAYKDGKFSFYEKNAQGEFIQRDGMKNYSIELYPEPDRKERIWLQRDYEDELWQLVNKETQSPDGDEIDLEKKSKRYGEVSITEPGTGIVEYWYSDLFGLFRKD